MQVPCSWIKELVDIDWSAEEVAERLTHSGAEAEIEAIFKDRLENVVVGKVLEMDPIEGTDHLQKGFVDIGEEPLQVVCGAPNCKKGQKVAFAKIGAVLGEDFKIKKVKLKGVESHGVICSEKELGISDDHSGIMVLDDDAPIGSPVAEYLGLDDYAIKLDLTPNRMDMMYAIGVARDLACLAGKRIKRPEFEIKEIDEKASDYIKVSIEDKDACPRYAARIIKDIKIGPSPWWIRKRLLMCGIRPISNVVDIGNLVMMETGHPLHAFDYDKFDRKEIVVRRAKEKEKFMTLDDKEHVLTPDVLMITDGEKGVAAGGVMGGLETEVSNETTTILLEAAYFNPVTIRRSRQKLGTITESSQRFEKGVDPNGIPYALDRAANLLEKYAGGKTVSGIADCYPKKIAPAVIEFRPERANGLLGTAIPKERMINILRGIEFEIEDKGTLKVTVPTWQNEITREVDLIEEIIRLEGYDAMGDVDRNLGPLYVEHPEDDLLKQTIKSTLVAQGYDEVYGSGFAHDKILRNVSDKPAVKILNPIAEDLNVLQNDINYSLLKAVGHNIAHRNIDLMLFELGTVFFPGNPNEEELQIGLALSGESENSWFARGHNFSFYDLKGGIDALRDECRIPELEYREENDLPYQEDSSFALFAGNDKIGKAGLVNRDIAKRFDIKQPVYTAVLDFEKILKVRLPEGIYVPLPRFPAAPRDLAVVVDEEVNVGNLIGEIKKSGGKILESVEIFDLYRGKPIPEGKKSIAFSLVYRLAERSLKSKEVNAVQEDIIDNIKKRFNAEIREG